MGCEPVIKTRSKQPCRPSRSRPQSVAIRIENRSNRPRERFDGWPCWAVRLLFEWRELCLLRRVFGLTCLALLSCFALCFTWSWLRIGKPWWTQKIDHEIGLSLILEVSSLTVWIWLKHWRNILLRLWFFGTMITLKVTSVNFNSHSIDTLSLPICVSIILAYFFIVTGFETFGGILRRDLPKMDQDTMWRWTIGISIVDFGVICAQNHLPSDWYTVCQCVLMMVWNAFVYQEVCWLLCIMDKTDPAMDLVISGNLCMYSLNMYMCNTNFWSR
ncbi:membrane protein S14 [Saimiriine betaherpesvirus 4]|uniref:Membrane protein S14 n=1 Tax=Saimiriine betaherpesvirus 4 TaxID=1535247 RepID=G8XT35_9BETA|nr:membrane protein S14 [Saimiriine betaherpesvirus 4]AEV80986.1 membrane protein S14 [Saimiriine betaherpesvirus 4]